MQDARIQDIGYGMQVVGCRIWVWDAGSGMQEAGYGIQEVGWSRWDTGCGMQETGCRVQGYRTLDVGCR